MRGVRSKARGDRVKYSQTEMVRYTTLEGLVRALREQPRERRSFEDVFSNTALDPSELERYFLFSPGFYTRNLIARGEMFELLTLCWEPGHLSPIHDHAGSDGWIRCVRGCIEEVRYRPELSAEAPRFERLGGAELDPGEASYINDDMAWHTVGNAGSTRAVSLHLYSPPIDSCQYYDAREQVVTTRTMSYFSKEGVRTDA